ncbi:MAG: ABC transporter substrate-binding protein [Candidatus Hodarchaeales archaeon]
MQNPRKIKTTVLLALFLVSFFFLSATTPISADRKGDRWYFVNFEYEDRLHIRKAMDMAIPRQQIIDSVLLGQGALLATPIEMNAIGYDPSIQARDFDIEAALDHMEAAFGYRYSDSAEDLEDRKGYFSMVIMSPTSRDDRMQWAALTTKCFQEIGIDVTLKYANWNVAVTVFTPPIEHQGFDYKHGGYDAFFVGWSGSPNSDVSQWFGKDNWAPYGTNIAYVDDPVVDDIIETSLKDPAIADRMAALVDFQEYFHENLPYFIVLQLMDLWALDPDLSGVSLSFDYPNYGNWSHATASEITIQTPGDLRDMNPMMQGSYYDSLATGAMHGSLVQRFPDDLSVYYGDIAKDWTYSEDGTVWTFDIRDGILFSDGTELTVDDVIFTFKQYINPEVVAYGGTNMASWLNETNIVKIDSNTVEFTINDFYAYAEDLFVYPILSKAEMSQVDDSDWATDATTTTFPPMGTGPYMAGPEADWDVTNSEVTMVLNPYYDGTLRDGPKGNPKNWVNDNPIPTINVKLIATAAACVADLKSGAINIIDSNVAIQPFLAEINASSWGRLEKELGWGHQGFYINQINPIWGMNPKDPRKMYPEDYGLDPPIDETSTKTTSHASLNSSQLPSISPSFDYLITLVLLVSSSIIVLRRRE